MIKELFHIEKNSTKEFWISHLVVLVSTVFAVYLAAAAGLQTAVEFELVQSERNSYYLQSSLLDEFKDNTDQALKISTDFLGKELDSNGKHVLFQYVGVQNERELDKFVWTSMQDSSDTFEVPRRILTGVRQYYKLADKAIYSVSHSTQRPSHIKREIVPPLLKATEEAQAKLIPLMQKELDRLRKRLVSKGVDL